MISGELREVETSCAHTLKMHFLLHWPEQLMKWGRESNMSTNICEVMHKTTLKSSGKKTNQHSDQCKQVLERSVERTLVSDACTASDLHHYVDGKEIDEWGDLPASRLVYCHFLLFQHYNVIMMLL